MDRRLSAFDVVTLPYPGFPTDLQPFALALAAVSDGTAMITENVFEARFMFVQELARLGADCAPTATTPWSRGRPALRGPGGRHDIRAGAALVLRGAGRPRASPRWPSRTTSTAATRVRRALAGVDIERGSADPT